MLYSEMILKAPLQDSLSISIRRLKNELKAIESAEQLQGRSTGALYVNYDRGRVYFREYDKQRKKSYYLRRNSNRLYTLAKQRYLELLIELLEYRQDPNSKTTVEHNDNVEKINKFMRDLEKAGIDFARVTLSDEQYKWAKANYRKKTISPSIRKYVTSSGVETRSKSEQKWGTRFEFFGIPYRYEMRLTVDVKEIISELEEELRSKGHLRGALYYYDGNSCIWNVPKEYAWMNERGSIWRTYDGKTQQITIYPDFIFKARDGELIVWEHEGMALKFSYRCNASERIFVLRETGAVSEKNIVFTFERDVNDSEEVDRLIMTHLIPRILF